MFSGYFTRNYRCVRECTRTSPVNDSMKPCVICFHGKVIYLFHQSTYEIIVVCSNNTSFPNHYNELSKTM